MNTVPNELVEAILVLATPGTAAALGSGAVHDPLDMLVGRLRLASVCRLWRDLLQDCNLHQLLLQSLSTTAAAPPPPLSLYLRPRKDPHRPRCGLREACWIIAHQQCKEMWGCTWQALRPLARSAQEPVDFRKRLIANLLRQARVWFGGGSRARSAAELQEWGARTQAKEEEQLKQFQRHLNADSTQLDRKYIEESSNMPLYLQRPWKEMQAAAVELLSSLKARDYQQSSVLDHIVVYGPRGCGKTTLVRYLAAELELPLLQFECPRIQGLEEEFGVELGSTLLRDVFNLARKHRPCIILLHNFDALSATSKFAARSENQAMTEIDGLPFREPPVFIIGETSEPQRTSAALYRRMKNWVHIGLPDLSTRRTILREALEQRDISVGNRQLLEMTFKTEGFSVTDLIQICDDAVRLSLQTVLHSARAENTAEKVAAIKRFDPCWLNDQYLQGWGGYCRPELWNRDGTRRDGQLCPHHHQHIGPPFSLPTPYAFLPSSTDPSLSAAFSHDDDDDLYS